MVRGLGEPLVPSLVLLYQDTQLVSATPDPETMRTQKSPEQEEAGYEECDGAE